MNRTSFDRQIVQAVESKDYGSAGKDSTSINMAKVIRACFIINFGALTGNSILKFYASAATATKTTALAFNYRITGGDFGAASSDILGAETAVTSSGLTLTAATFDHRIITVEFEDVDMPSGKPFLNAEIDATATVMTVAETVIAIPRYAGRTPISIIS